MNYSVPNEYEPKRTEEQNQHHLPQHTEQKPDTKNYSPLPDLYLPRLRAERQDITRFLPFRTIEHFPRQGNEGLYGWTLKNKDGKIHLREDLEGKERLNTFIHESLHTPDEYETRRLTEWILESMAPEKENYCTKPPEYKR